MPHVVPSSAPARTQAALRQERWIGALLLLLLGATTVSGWLLHLPALVELRKGLVPMVFNTGLCFVVTGTALPLSDRVRRKAAAVATVTLTFLVLALGLTGRWATCWHPICCSAGPGRPAWPCTPRRG